MELLITPMLSGDDGKLYAATVGAAAKPARDAGNDSEISIERERQLMSTILATSIARKLTVPRKAI
jgi:hypothetical protein